MIGWPRPTASPAFTSGRSPGCSPKNASTGDTTSERLVTSARPARSVAVISDTGVSIIARGSSLVTWPGELAPGRERRPPAIATLGQPQGHVAQVHGQPGDAAGHRDDDPPRPVADPHRVAELQGRECLVARREIDEGDLATDQVVPAMAVAVEGQPAGAAGIPAAGGHAADDDQASDRHEEVIREIRDQIAALVRVVDAAN